MARILYKLLRGELVLVKEIKKWNGTRAYVFAEISSLDCFSVDSSFIFWIFLKSRSQIEN